VGLTSVTRRAVGVRRQRSGSAWCLNRWSRRR
jgi:hypothetical protein